jgi:hypothetical protein
MSGLHAPSSVGGHDVRVVDLGEGMPRRFASACLDCDHATLHRSAVTAATSACQHWQFSVHHEAAQRRGAVRRDLTAEGA